MAYIGNPPIDARSFGSTKFEFTATAGQTAFTGADDNNKTLSFTENHIEVYVNGVLMDNSDFSTSGGNTVTLAAAATVNDIISVIAIKVNVPRTDYVPKTGGTFTGAVTVEGNLTVEGTTTTIDSANAQTVDLGDNDKIQLGDDNDLQIYHDGNSKIVDVGGGKLELHSDGTGVFIQKGATEYMGKFETDGAVTLYYDNAVKLATTSTGVDVTGTLAATSLTGNLTGNVTGNVTGDVTGSVTGDISKTGDLNIDVSGDIILDADGGDIRFRDNGLEIGSIIMDDGSNTFILKSAQSDADIKFNGIDGGSGITALTLDMSEGGHATFNKGATFNEDVTINAANGEILTIVGGTDLAIHVDGNEVSFRADPGNNESSTVMTFDTDGSEVFRLDNQQNMAFGHTTAASQFFFKAGTGTSVPSFTTLGTAQKSGSSDPDNDACSLMLGSRNGRDFVSGNYIAGIGFDHLLNHVEGTPFNYSSQGGPHAFIGLRMWDSPGRERSGLVFATREGTSNGNKTVERMNISPYGKVNIGVSSGWTGTSNLNAGVRISNGGINVSDGGLTKTYSVNNSIPQSALVIPVTDGTNTQTSDAGGGWANIGWGTGTRSGEAMHRNNDGRYKRNGTGTACGFYIEAGTGEAGGICLDEDSVTVYGSSDTGSTFRIVDKDSDIVTAESLQGSWNWQVRGNVNANATLGSVSDQRLKKSFQTETNPNILTDFANLQLKSYIRVDSYDYVKNNYENEEELREVGLVAQEVESVFPDCVSSTRIVDPRGWDGIFEEIGETLTDIKSVNINGLLYKTIQTVQALIEENNALKARVEALENN